MIKLSHVKIAVRLSFLMKVNRHFTRKRVSRTSRKGVLIAEQPESNREVEAAMAEAAEAETGGKQKGEYRLSFF